MNLDRVDLLNLINMELIIYIFLFLLLFLGVIFNLKITNYKKIKEIRNKVKGNSKKNN